VHWLLKKIS